MRITYIVFIYCLVTSKTNQSSQIKLKDIVLRLLNTILVLCSNVVLFANYLFNSLEFAETGLSCFFLFHKNISCMNDRSSLYFPFSCTVHHWILTCYLCKMKFVHFKLFLHNKLSEILILDHEIFASFCEPQIKQ